MHIQRAAIAEIDFVAELFDLYRQFYEQDSDLEGVKEFLKDRLENNESVIFIAINEDGPIGFVQLYPSFTSVGMKRSWILNDLYVKPQSRGKGAGELLIKQAIDFAAITGGKGLFLETGRENFVAQKLYEKVGFKKEMNYFYYYCI